MEDLKSWLCEDDVKGAQASVDQLKVLALAKCGQQRDHCWTQGLYNLIQCRDRDSSLWFQCGVLLDEPRCRLWLSCPKAKEDQKKNMQHLLAVARCMERHEWTGDAASDDAEALALYRRIGGLKDADDDSEISFSEFQLLPQQQEVAVLDQVEAMERWHAVFRVGCMLDSEGRGRAALRRWMCAARAGHSWAQFNVGVALETGEGVEKTDEALAGQWYQWAARGGNCAAQFNWAVMLGASDEAGVWYEKAAQAGEWDAQWNLAMWLKKRGQTLQAAHWAQKVVEATDKEVEADQLYSAAIWTLECNQDDLKALQWLKKAALLNHAHAQFMLGQKLLLELSSPKDALDWLEKASKCEELSGSALFLSGYAWELLEGDGSVLAAQAYSAACKKGNIEATVNLGIWNLRKGNKAEAVALFLTASNAGNAEGTFNLAVCVANGDGIDKNAEKASALFLAAAEKGHARAQYSLAARLERGEGVVKDMTKAVGWMKKAAEQGDADAQYAYGACRCLGEGVTKDLKDGAHWYELASQQGHVKATMNLGMCFEKGDGVEKDTTKAAQLYTKASDAGDMFAQYYLGLMYENGEGVEVDIKKAAELIAKAAAQGMEEAVIWFQEDLENSSEQANNNDNNKK